MTLLRFHRSHKHETLYRSSSNLSVHSLYMQRISVSTVSIISPSRFRQLESRSTVDSCRFQRPERNFKTAISGNGKSLPETVDWTVGHTASDARTIKHCPSLDNVHPIVATTTSWHLPPESPYHTITSAPMTPYHSPVPTQPQRAHETNSNAGNIGPETVRNNRSLPEKMQAHMRKRRSQTAHKMLYDGGSLCHGEAPCTGWEYVLAFRTPNVSILHETGTSADSASSRARAETLGKLRHAGFAYSQLWVPGLESILVRIALPEKILRYRAEDRGIELRLKRRYGGGYLPYREDRAECFVNYTRQTYFTPAQRLRVTLDVLGSSADWGAAIDVDALRHAGVLSDAYPVHDAQVRQSLLQHAVYEQWWNPLYRPSFMRLRNYLGTRLALYFAFLNFYTRMLVGVSLLSLPVYVVLNISTSPYIIMPLRFLYGTVLVFWACYFQKFWRRRNAVLNVQWGTTDFKNDSNNEIRPQFIGVPRLGFYSAGGFVPLDDLATAEEKDEEWSEWSDDDGEGTVIDHVTRRFQDDFKLNHQPTGTVLSDLPSFPYSDKKLQQRRISLSVAWTTLFTLAMCSLTFLIIFYTAEMIEYFGRDGYGPVVPGVVLGILIFICDNGWKSISEKLSKWENHRTTQAFQNSLIVKRFVFQFVSNYASLFYIAFVKPYTPKDPCQPNPRDGMPDCMLELQTQLTSLVITNATLQQLLEIGTPALIVLIRRIILSLKARRAHIPASSHLRNRLLHLDSKPYDKDMDDIAESKLDSYENTVEDYGELVIQYGYIALFGLAYPPATIICLLNNSIEMRSDAFKILALSKRVPADDVADIGKWSHIINFISYTAIWTNAAMLFFTASRETTVVRDITLSAVVLFFLFEHILLCMKKAIDRSVSDVPGKTLRHTARQEYLIYRCFNIGERPEYSQNMTVRIGERQIPNIDQSLNKDLLSALRSNSHTA